MAITFLELSKQLEGLARDLTGQEQGRLMLKLGSDALALIKMRVQEKGEMAEGGKFPPYSTKTTLVGSSSFIQKEAAQKYFKSKPEWRKVGVGTTSMRSLALLEGGYKKLRELQGRQTAFVDFTFTGRLLGNIKTGEKGDVQLVSPPAELASGRAVIKATQELEKKKLSGLTERKGEILALSKSEEKQLSGYYQTWVEKLLKKHGFK
jgi:hypothetical protein